MPQDNRTTFTLKNYSTGPDITLMSENLTPCCSLPLLFHCANDCKARRLWEDACAKLYWTPAVVACLYLVVFQISGVGLHLCQRSVSSSGSHPLQSQASCSNPGSVPCFLGSSSNLKSWFAARTSMRAPASWCEVLASTVWRVSAKSVRAGCPPEVGLSNVGQPHFYWDFCDSGNPVAV